MSQFLHHDVNSTDAKAKQYLGSSPKTGVLKILKIGKKFGKKLMSLLQILSI